jgi:uncharacterized protein YndB with AHSA1/START domain
MAWLSNLLKAMAALLLVLVLVAYMLPDRHLVERQRVIDRTPEQLWPLLAQPRQWVRWSPWHARDPQMQLAYSLPESGQGAEWRWASDSQGRGRMRFDHVQAPTRLGYVVTFESIGSVTSGEFRLEPVAGGTRVTWTLESTVGSNVLLRWFSLLADYRLGRDLESGLERLAEVAVAP